MQKFCYFILLLFTLIFSGTQLSAQTPDSIMSVQITVNLDTVTPSITLEWERDFPANNYAIFRRDNPETSFQFIATLPDSVDNYKDESIEKGIVYEYKIQRTGGPGTGTGFVNAGFQVNPVHFEGRCLILVHEQLHDDILFSLEKYMQSLLKDGWLPELIKISSNQGIPAIKNLIRSKASSYPEGLTAVLLLGNIPVPYSGNMAPDGHVPDHQGAWVADTYYADLNGFWTDFAVDNPNGSRPETKNVPGDGKFDQNTIPGKIDIQLGRVDFSRLPALEQDEPTLTNKYLEKNIAFRMGQIPTEHRGIIQNNFPSFQEGFGQSGLKNFTSLFGKENVSYGSYRGALNSEPYIWSYGCGPGSYTSASGIADINTMRTDSLQTIFTMIFGSYFGDWDVLNNLLRGALASGTVLTNVWAGRPAWHFHHMGLGSTIGHSAKMSQNNLGFSEYGGIFNRYTHVTLLGDPILKMYPFGPVDSIWSAEAANCVEIQWHFPEDVVKDFYLYRRSSESDPFELITPEPISANSYCDPCLDGSPQYEYLLREVALRYTPTGSFYNLAHGALLEVENFIDNRVIADFTNESDDLLVNFRFDGQKAEEWYWQFGDGTESYEQNPQHLYESAGIYTVTMIARNQCFSDTITMDIEVLNTGIDRLAKAGIRVFPTLFVDQINIQSESFQISDLYLHDSYGKIVYNKNVAMDQGLILSNLESLAPGVYFLSLTANGKKFRTKLVKI